MDPERAPTACDLLRQYLQYAESRGANLGERPWPSPSSTRSRSTCATASSVPASRSSRNTGCSGYRIDYVAKHPRDPGRLVLAIECDGAAYHSSPTARDRDRLRQDHLERLGWKFHRIWSTDWFRDKAKEIDAVKAAYDSAVAEADEQPRPDRAPITTPPAST